MCVYSKNSGWRNKCFWSLFKAIVICEINCLFPLTKMCPAVLITRNSFSTLLLKFLSLMKKWCLMNEGNKFFLYWFKAVTQQNHSIIMYTWVCLKTFWSYFFDEIFLLISNLYDLLPYLLFFNKKSQQINLLREGIINFTHDINRYHPVVLPFENLCTHPCDKWYEER